MSLLLNNNIGYTVVGNPTIIDGIVSDFSINNYLTLSAFTRNNFKQIFKIKTPNSFIAYAGLWQENVSTTYRSKIMFTNAGKLIINLSSTGSGWDIANNIVSDTALNSNTIYYIEFAYQNNKYYLRYSLNGLDFYNLIEPINSSYILRTEGSIIGFNTANNVAFNGEMDLNNFYIKENEITIFNGKQTASTSIQDIKFNNNIGYTVVGAPNISDGIASNFSDGNYIKLQSNIPIITSFEENIRFKITQDCAGKSLLSYSTTYNSNNLEGNINISNNLDSINVSLFIKYDGTYEEYSIQYNFSQHLNKYFTFKVYTDLSNVYLYLYDENNILVATNTYTNINLAGIIDDNKILIGNIYDESDYWPSEIDLNNTYIKFNSVTWFNGKEQASSTINYVKINNILVWTNPNL